MPTEEIGDSKVHQPATAVEPRPRKAPAQSDNDLSSVATLSEAHRAEWLRTGDVKDRGTVEPPKRKIDEGEKLLSELNEEDREKWLRGEVDTGEVVYQGREKETAKAAEKSAGSEESPESEAPESREAAPKQFTRLNELPTDQNEAARAHERTAATANERLKKEAETVGNREEWQRIIEAAAAKPLSKRLAELIHWAGPHLENQYKFTRALYLDSNFRARIDGVDARLNSTNAQQIASEIFGIMTDFDREASAPPPKRFTSAPAPGTRGAGGGKATAPRDPVQAALKNGDFTNYMAEMNRREAGR